MRELRLNDLELGILGFGEDYYFRLVVAPGQIIVRKS